MAIAAPISNVSFAERSEPTTPPSVLRGLRICLIAGTLGQGGAEKQFFYIATALKAAGAHLLILCLTKGEFWEARLREVDIPVKFIGESPYRFKRLLATIKAARAFHPDLIQSQHFYVNGYASLAARVCRLRSIGAVRGSGTADFHSSGRMFGMLNLHLPHRLAANSQAAMENLRLLGCPDRKLRYLPNVIDTNRFKRRQHQGDGMLTIAGIGRMGPEKRFDFFLKVLFEWRKKVCRPFRAYLVGDGPLREELESLAHTLGLLDGTVKFLGKVADVARVCEEADILMLTSAHEGTPNVIMEAMACGLPVVATSVGDVPKLVRDQVSGFVLDGNDLQGFVDMVEKLANDSRLRESMGDAGRSFIETNHDVSVLPGLLANLYADVLA